MSIPTWLLGLSLEQYFFLHISWVSVIANMFGAICFTALLALTPNETSQRKSLCCTRFITLIKSGLLEGLVFLLRCLPSMFRHMYTCSLFRMTSPGEAMFTAPPASCSMELIIRFGLSCWVSCNNTPQLSFWSYHGLSQINCSHWQELYIALWHTWPENCLLPLS